jgi:hypothetical protein
MLLFSLCKGRISVLIRWTGEFRLSEVLGESLLLIALGGVGLWNLLHTVLCVCYTFSLLRALRACRSVYKKRLFLAS